VLVSLLQLFLRATLAQLRGKQLQKQLRKLCQKGPLQPSLSASSIWTTPTSFVQQPLGAHRSPEIDVTKTYWGLDIDWSNGDDFLMDA
jgi:hypothetical protein